MEHLLHDTGFWVLLAMIVFVAIAVKKGKGPILALLDARTDRIRADLEEAARLRAEAEALLARTQKKNREAAHEAQRIIDNAKETAQRLQEEAREKLSESLKRREAQLLDRIALAENAAVQDIRNQAAEIAARAAEIMLRESATKNADRLVDESIRSLAGRLN